MTPKNTKIIKDLASVPPMPEHMRARSEDVGSLLGGRASLERVTATVTIDGEEYEFQFSIARPRTGARLNVLYIREPMPMSEDLPIEEIVVMANLFILDVSNIRGQRRLGKRLDKYSIRSSFKEAHTAAWCSGRILDYILSSESDRSLSTIIVGAKEQYPAALAMAIEDGRQAASILALTSHATNKESRLLTGVVYDIGGSLLTDVHIYEGRSGATDAMTERLFLPPDKITYHLSTNYLGADMWRDILDNFCK